jgi:hypothetical protein
MNPPMQQWLLSHFSDHRFTTYTHRIGHASFSVGWHQNEVCDGRTHGRIMTNYSHDMTVREISPQLTVRSQMKKRTYDQLLIMRVRYDTELISKNV